jgi:hypothetical protein
MQGFRRAIVVLVVLMAVTSITGSAGAAVLEIQFSGVNLTYNGTDLFDAAVANTTRSGTRADADPLETMAFLVDGVQVGTVVTTDIYLDTYIKGLSGVPAAGGVVNTAGNGNAFGVDLLTKATDPAFGLALNIDQFQFYYSGNKISIATAGPSTSLVTQDLPFGLEFDASKPISIVFSSANLSNVTTANDVVTGLNAAGTGNITGTLIPEPASLVLLAAGGLLIGMRKRTRH